MTTPSRAIVRDSTPVEHRDRPALRAVVAHGDGVGQGVVGTGGRAGTQEDLPRPARRRDLAEAPPPATSRRWSRRDRRALGDHAHRDFMALSSFLRLPGAPLVPAGRGVVSDGSESYGAAIQAHVGHATHVLDSFRASAWSTFAQRPSLCGDIALMSATSSPSRTKPTEVPRCSATNEVLDAGPGFRLVRGVVDTIELLQELPRAPQLGVFG